MRFLIWTGVEEWLTETVAVDLRDEGLRAIGTQLGADPAPFRVDYRLEAPDDFVTQELELTATAEGWRRQLVLRHDGSGGWSAELEDDGEAPGGPWGGELPDLSEARDIDIQNSPLTNTMPILRHGFDREGSGDFLMAFVRTRACAWMPPRSATNMSVGPMREPWCAIWALTATFRPTWSSTRTGCWSSTRASLGASRPVPASTGPPNGRIRAASRNRSLP